MEVNKPHSSFRLIYKQFASIEMTTTFNNSDDCNLDANTFKKKKKSYFCKILPTLLNEHRHKKSSIVFRK